MLREDDGPPPDTEYIVCANHKCAFEMKESELERVQVDPHLAKFVCPVCRHDKWSFTGKKIEQPKTKKVEQPICGTETLHL